MTAPLLASGVVAATTDGREEERRKEHPCSTPTRRRRDREGDLWACSCGRVFVLRNNWNYAGDVWVWQATNLTVPASAR